MFCCLIHIDINNALETSNQSINLHLSTASSQMTNTRLSDEHIASVSDNELVDSPTSVCSQSTTRSELQKSDKTVSNEHEVEPKTPRRSQFSGRLTKAKLENLAFQQSPNSTPGPITRSKKKALTQQPTTNEDHYDDYFVSTTRTRATRSVTSSPPSPVKSVVSSASTTVARNSLKRKGSNRVKKPTTIISPTTPRAENSTEEKRNVEETDDNKRYNLRTRIRTPQKYGEGDNDPTTTQKKVRRVTSKKTAGLYKIDETAVDSTQQIQSFAFSNPNNFQFNSQTSESVPGTLSVDNSEDDANSPFTFSPPQSTTKKKQSP
jgi:hypothetical protein